MRGEGRKSWRNSQKQRKTWERERGKMGEGQKMEGRRQRTKGGREERREPAFCLLYPHDFKDWSLDLVKLLAPSRQYPCTQAPGLGLRILGHDKECQHHVCSAPIRSLKNVTLLTCLPRAQPNELVPHEGVVLGRELREVFRWECYMGQKKKEGKSPLELPVGPRAVLRRAGTFHSQESSQKVNSVFPG